MTTPALSDRELYQLEKAKRADRVSPAMIEAAAELQRQQELAVAARKGGRPKGPDLKFGRGKIPRARLLDFGDDAPGRPERLHHDRENPPTVAPAAPLLPDPPRAETPMATTRAARTFAPRQCARSGREFTPSGPSQKFCGTCDDCTAAAGESTPPRKKGAQKSTKKPKTEKKRARIETGYGRKAISANGTYSDTIAKMLAEADMLDTRRTQLLAAVEHLELLGRPA